MLTFAIILAISSFAVEMTIASKVPFWRQIAYQYKLANLGMSLSLSFTLATLFGAAGLIAMTAAIMATLFSVPGYAILHVIYDSDVAKQVGGNLLSYYWSKFIAVMRDLFILIYNILRIITLPVVIIRGIYNFFKKFSNRNHATA
jgi:hypothetical protein